MDWLGRDVDRAFRPCGSRTPSGNRQAGLQGRRTQDSTAAHAVYSGIAKLRKLKEVISMRAITVEPKKPGTAKWEEVQEPDARQGSVLVEAIAVGVCGTDVEIVEGKYE